MLSLFDVIWIYDQTTRPQKMKMYICLDFDRGWFLRINTKNYPRPSVAISKEQNPFLDHDSHAECGILEVDEYEVEDAVQRGGVVGKLNLVHRTAILEAHLAMPIVRERDKAALRELLSDA
ncbi:hypothetical protein [Paracoccus homiensis]|uniref:Uncharacterized protein n=1 Tax=Paracoccus homiensis TaxID=364199 RepID=A0A1I0GX77_9RHOB|nr:hypothetical protein [Paracoccus homiensis]SET75794.1 hypothetical protein SAMN04489858_109129 [Paracoccus homiensis]